MPTTLSLAPMPRAPRKDPRTRVVAVAVIACSLRDGALTEEGRITQVLPFGCNVVQGEALALALLLKHTTGVAAVTADCKPAILCRRKVLSSRLPTPTSGMRCGKKGTASTSPGTLPTVLLQSTRTDMGIRTTGASV